MVTCKYPEAIFEAVLDHWCQLVIAGVITGIFLFFVAKHKVSLTYTAGWYFSYVYSHCFVFGSCLLVLVICHVSGHLPFPE